MKKVLYIIVLQLMLAIAGFSQNFEMVILEEEDIPELQLNETSYYIGKGLFGHINGGSELLHEYGFEALAVQKIQKDKDELAVEIYKMKNAEAAFGIFSVSKRNSSVIDTSNYFSCVTPNQNLICSGNYFISIINYTQNKEAKIYVRNISQVLKDKIQTSQFKYPQIFNSKILKKYKSRLKYLKGPLGIQNNLTSWELWFEKLTDFKIYYLPVEEDDFDFASVKFNNEEEMKYFLTASGFNENEIKIGNIIYSSSDNQKISVKIINNSEVYLLVSGAGTIKLEDILKNI